jgi:hypothetical protein
VIEAVVDAKVRERRDAWQQSAFVAWSQYFFQPRHSESSERASYGEWLEMFGLADPDSAEPEQTPEEVLAGARELMAQFGVDL